MGSSREDLTAFPRGARVVAGHQLHRLEQGLAPDHFKPMPGVGSGAGEIIIDIGDEDPGLLRGEIQVRHLCPPRLREEDPEDAAG